MMGKKNKQIAVCLIGKFSLLNTMFCKGYFINQKTGIVVRISSSEIYVGQIGQMLVNG